MAISVKNEGKINFEETPAISLKILSCFLNICSMRNIDSSEFPKYKRLKGLRREDFYMHSSLIN